MTRLLPYRALRWLAVSVATLALATSPYADGWHDVSPAPKTTQQHEAMPGMSADEHARMAGDGHQAMPGMSADEHARMAGDSHEAMPGMSADEHAQMAGHDEPAATGKRPVALVLGGFGLFNGLVLLYAVVLRRRPAVRKRLEMLARVRATAGKRTALATPAPGEARS